MAGVILLTAMTVCGISLWVKRRKLEKESTESIEQESTESIEQESTESIEQDISEKSDSI